MPLVNTIEHSGHDEGGSIVRFSAVDTILLISMFCLSASITDEFGNIDGTGVLVTMVLEVFIGSLKGECLLKFPVETTDDFTRGFMTTDVFEGGLEEDNENVSEG